MIKSFLTGALFLLLFTNMASAKEYTGETKANQSCSISLEENLNNHTTKVLVYTPSTLYRFTMPIDTLEYKVSLIEKDDNEYGPYIGAPITIFGIGVRDIKLTLSLAENGQLSSYSLKVNKLFVSDITCENLTLD